MSTRGRSGALPNESQSCPILEDVRGALCQVRCSERNKDIIDDQNFIVATCLSNIDLFKLFIQECVNKIKGKNPAKLTKICSQY